MHPEIEAFVRTVDPAAIAQICAAPLGAGEAFRAEFHKVARLVNEEAGDAHWVCFNTHCISQILIDLNAGVVTKSLGKFREFGLEGREVYWLERLRASGIVPELVRHDADTICTRYVGEPVNQRNLPEDWPAQAEWILSALAGFGCSHNDIKCDNLMVLGGAIRLIDFGWATRSADPIPPEWPEGIGRQHRIAIHEFDDRRAIFAALQSAEDGNVESSIVMPD
jgi:hypothetical protein